MEKTFQIYYTSDTHGHIFPVNYASNCPENSGLLNLAAQVEKGGNTLVLDGGDSLQGTPLTQYYLENRDQWPGPSGGCCLQRHGSGLLHPGQPRLQLRLWSPPGLSEYHGRSLPVHECRGLGGELRIRPWAVHTLANGCG